MLIEELEEKEMKENAKVNFITFIAPMVAFAILTALAMFFFKLPLNFASGRLQAYMALTGAIAVLFGFIFHYVKNDTSLYDYDDAIGQIVFAGAYALLLVVIGATWLFSSVVFHSKKILDYPGI
jgi:hypothetical protein